MADNDQTQEEKVEEVAEQAQEAEKAEEKAKEAAEKAEAAAEKASDVAKAMPDKEEVKEEAKEGPKKEEKPEKKPEPSGKFKNIIKDIEGLSALELSELVKALEERFGVSAAAPAFAPGPAAAGAPVEGGDEEKSNYNVVLTASGGNKIAAIKAVRECVPDLGLKEAKDLVDGAPKTIKENVPTEEAKKMKEKLEAAGATVELQ